MKPSVAAPALGATCAPSTATKRQFSLGQDLKGHGFSRAATLVSILITGFSR
jgi:hypothetical protein